MNFSFPNRDSLSAIKVANHNMSQKLYFSDEKNLTSMLSGYVEGVGVYDDWTLHSARLRMDQIAKQTGLIDDRQSLFDRFKRLSEHAETILDRTPKRCYPFILEDRAIQKKCLISETTNNYFDSFVPSPPGMLLKAPRRPPFNLCSFEPVETAEVICHPFLFQVQSRNGEWYLPGASSRPLSLTAYSALRQKAELKSLDRPIVIIQDRFPGSNFAHFLFDWIPRIILFADFCNADQNGETLRRTLFLMGGAPGEFEALILNNVCSNFNLSPEQFYFPSYCTLFHTTKSLFWFSDCVEVYSHPALMGHAVATASIQRSISGLRIANETKETKDRIFISRSDATQRRVFNEVELFERLGELGFAKVILANLSIREQIALFSQVKFIVAPHGMGLTHLMFSSPGVDLIELHHPAAGTDAYAFMSFATGISYQALFGTPIENGKRDFSVDVELLGSLVRATSSLRSSEPERDFQFNLKIECSRTRLKLNGSPSTEAAWEHGAQPMSSSIEFPIYTHAGYSALIAHRRGDPRRILDTNAGYWSGVPVEAGQTYRASCLVWIPSNFVGEKVELSIGEWHKQKKNNAIISLRDKWQEISASVLSPDDCSTCNIIIRLTAENGALIFSSHWRLDIE